MPIAQALPSREFLLSRLTYDEVHGHLYWKSRPASDFRSNQAYSFWARRCALHRADQEMSSGYLRVRIRIDGEMQTFQAHRVIWKMAYGEDPVPCIDHIDRDRRNNRLFNLRVVTIAENNRNRSYLRLRGFGLGVYTTPGGRFRTQKRKAGKIVYLGTFDTHEEAQEAFLAA